MTRDGPARGPGASRLRPARAAVTVVGLMAVVALVAASCGSAPGPASSPPPVVVPGRASDFSTVYVEAGNRQARLSAAQTAGMVPLLAAKEFRPPEPLADYGLAPARARLVYQARGAGATVLLVGGPTFDYHFIYVMRPGGRSLYTVATGQLAPVLALVGVVAPPPR
ncbi:MAG TPA: hypothetical protein VNF50_08140 [Acidimicrobiales bacterium]|nr:hypothetical protein [Acidimicrobiales bacterium]